MTPPAKYAAAHRWRAELRARIAAGDPTVVHGRSEATYACGCRCWPCKDVATERRASRRARAVKRRLATTTNDMEAAS